MGVSQEEAAEALGISASAIQQIERGVLPLSEEIAKLMLLWSGAKIPTGLCRETAEPIAWDNLPYDTSSVHQWYRHVFPIEAIDKFNERLSRDLTDLINSAARKGCLVPFMWAIQTALGEQARNFRIAGEGFLDDETLTRLFGGLIERAHANGIELEEAFKMARPPVKKSSGSKRKRRGQP